MKRKAAFGRVFAVYVALMAILIFVSRSLYNYRLPEVTAMRPIQGKLDFTIEGEAELLYPCVTNVYGDMDGRVSEVFVESGDEVKKGQRIMSFKTEEEGRGQEGPEQEEQEAEGQEQKEQKQREITAEEDGVILFVGVEKGMYVSSVQNTVLYKIAKKTDELAAELFITAKQYEYVHPDSIVRVKVRGMDETMEGRVQRIISCTDQDREGYLARISVPIEEAGLAGHHAELTIQNSSVLYDTLVPVSALFRDGTGYYVLVLKEDNSVLGDGFVARRMSVDFLDSDELYCAVRGLPSDERVIVDATDEISDGSKVYYGGVGAQ